MNQDIINACKASLNANIKRTYAFTESRDGEIRYFGEKYVEDWQEFYRGYYKDLRAERNENKLHIFKLNNGELEWIETYNDDTDMVDIPVNIDDDVFLAIAKEAHEKDITINQVIINLLQNYIDKEKHEPHKKK